LSNLAGQIIQIEEVKEGGHLIFPNHESIGHDKFHVSIVHKGFYYNDTDILVNDILDVLTYSFIEPSIWQIKYEEINTPPSSIYASVTLEEDDGKINYGVISGTLSAASNTKQYRRVKMKREDNRIIVIVHMEKENQLRYKVLENVQNGASYTIKTSELISAPFTYINVPKNYESIFQIIGITNYTETRASFNLQGNFSGNDGLILANYILRDTFFFDKYLTRITLLKDQETYELKYLGEPLQEYYPTPIDFSINEEMINDFQFNPGNDFTVYRGEWTFSEIEENKRHIVTWEVFGDFPSTFNAPNLNEFLPEETNWFNAEKLALKTIQEIKYSKYSNYQKWKDAQFKFFKPIFFARIFDSVSPDEEGYLEIKTLNK